MNLIIYMIYIIRLYIVALLFKHRFYFQSVSDNISLIKERIFNLSAL